MLKMSEEDLITTLLRIHTAILKKKSLFLMCVKLNILQSISVSFSFIDAFRWKTLMDADNGP